MGAFVLGALLSPSLASASQITFQTRSYPGTFPGSSGAAFSIWNSLQSPPPAGYCTALLTSATGISNQAECQGSSADIAYMTTINFTTSVAGPFYVRAGGDWGWGGVLLVDNVVWQERWSNMFWAGNWAAPTQFLSGSTALLPAGAHQLTVLAFEDCCDGAGEIDYSQDGTTWSPFSSSDGLPSPSPVNFGTVAVGSTGSPIPVDLYFTSAVVGVTASVLTQGATGLDFTDAGTGTCTTNGTGHDYAEGNTCSVNVTFAPQHAGARYGAVNLRNGSGNVVATGYIYGTGSGPQITFSPFTIFSLGAGFNTPSGVAVDGDGNIYTADNGNNAVKEMPAFCTSSSCVTAVGGGFNAPSGVGVDGAGNIYVADEGNLAVKEIPPGCSSLSCVTTLGGGFESAKGVALDRGGNVYVADTGNNAVKEMPPGCATSSCVMTLGSGFSQPAGVAVDGSGNVYVADTGNNAVKEMPSGCSSSSCVTTLGGGFSSPYGVAVDAAGNIYIADRASNAIKEMPSGCSSASCVASLATLNTPSGITLDGYGNVYAASSGANALFELTAAFGPTLNFPNTFVGSESSPEIATVQNIGNAPLVFAVPASGTNPSVSADFSLNVSSTCPVLNPSSVPAALAAGASCNLSIDFVPPATGRITGTAVLTDNNLNVSDATQSIALSGIGVATTITPTVAVQPASFSITTAQSDLVTVTLSGGNGNPTPTGSIALTSGTYNSGATTLSAGSAVITIPAGQLAVGSDTLTATYTPDGGSSSTYNGAAGTAPVTVMQATIGCTTGNPNPNPNPAALVAPSDFNGDCKSDILFRNSNTAQFETWFINGTAISGQESLGNVGSPWSVQGIGDFNGDGKADILWQNSSTGQLEIWFMNGTTAL
ncbi:MAG TPA: CCXG family PEP-CTERM protein, partial [Acidobacteriaceae bacterium]